MQPGLVRPIHGCCIVRDVGRVGRARQKSIQGTLSGDAGLGHYVDHGECADGQNLDASMSSHFAFPRVAQAPKLRCPRACAEGEVVTYLHTRCLNARVTRTICCDGESSDDLVGYTFSTAHAEVETARHTKERS